MNQSAPTTPTVKTEFTEVLTASDLLSHTSSSPELLSIVTETTLLPPSPTQPTPEECKRLVTLYDETFTTRDQYQAFVDNTLTPWKEIGEFKYFNVLYSNYCNTKQSAQNLSKIAQSMLEEANRLRRENQSQTKELAQQIQNIRRTELRKKIFNPKIFHPKPPRPPIREINPQHTPGRSTPTAPRYTFPQCVVQCYDCNSQAHIHRNCPQFRCKYC